MLSPKKWLTKRRQTDRLYIYIYEESPFVIDRRKETAVGRDRSKYGMYTVDIYIIYASETVAAGTYYNIIVNYIIRF